MHIEGKIMTREEEITAQAKKIMDDFFVRLDSVDVPEEFGLEREKQMREDAVIATQKSFRDMMFINAPQKDEDYLYAEKKQW